MKSRRPNHSLRQRGILLLECLIYVAVVMLVVGLAMTLLYRSLEANRNLDRNAQDIARALRVGERWREDVRRATGPIQLERVEDLDQVRIPQSGGAVFYTWTEGSLWRTDASGTNYLPVLNGVKSCQITRDQRAHLTAFRLEIELASAPKAARLRPLFSFGAVPQIPPRHENKP